MIFFTIATTLCAIAAQLTDLTVYRALTGIFAGSVIPISFALIGDIFPVEKRQSSIGTFFGIAFLGQGLSMVLGGSISYFLNWRGVFAIFVAITTVATILLINSGRKISTIFKYTGGLIMLIQLRNLTKTYQHHDRVINTVKNLSLDIPKGLFVTITGASGSGKTTLLLILGDLLRPTSRKMSYNDKEINLQNNEESPDFRSEHVGFVMQSFALVPYLTAIENIMIALNVKNSNTAENRKRALELLEWVGLADRSTHYPKELSAGQQQRVAIARALANTPDLLLADEPTGNLDPGLSEEILDILKEINVKQKTTVVMVTHSLMAAEYRDTKIQLKDENTDSKSSKI